MSGAPTRLEPEFFDSLETRDPERRENEQLSALAAQVANAQANAPAFAER